MGAVENQVKFLTKVVHFNGQKMTLFSIDGNTWSSRKLELAEIKTRQEQQRAELAGKKEDEVEAVLPENDKDDAETDLDNEPEMEASEEQEGLGFIGAEEAKSALKAKPVRVKGAKLNTKLPAKPVFDKKKTAVAQNSKKSLPKKGKTEGKKLKQTKKKKAA